MVVPGTVRVVGEMVRGGMAAVVVKRLEGTVDLISLPRPDTTLELAGGRAEAEILVAPVEQRNAKLASFEGRAVDGSVLEMELPTAVELPADGQVVVVWSVQMKISAGADMVFETEIGENPKTQRLVLDIENQQLVTGLGSPWYMGS
jgi:hypothetical protein